MMTGARAVVGSASPSASSFCSLEVEGDHAHDYAADSANSTSLSPCCQQQQQNKWIQTQELLRRKLVLHDDFPWTIPSQSQSPESSLEPEPDKRSRLPLLRYVGGVDVSVSKDDPSISCAALVVLDLHCNLDVVYQVFDLVRFHVPYVPGFLAFRESPILIRLLEDMKRQEHPFYPQLLMVDGNGLLHPRGFGLACHLGVLADIPTIGIGKNLHHVDGLTQSGVRQLLEDRANCNKDLITLVGNSGQVWGAAMRLSPRSSKPIFISVGHRISLDSCIEAVKLCCKFRVPEPVRQADIRSRRCLQSSDQSKISERM